MSEWLTEWQGHLLSCCGQLNRRKKTKNRVLWSQTGEHVGHCDLGQHWRKDDQRWGRFPTVCRGQDTRHCKSDNISSAVWLLWTKHDEWCSLYMERSNWILTNHGFSNFCPTGEQRRKSFDEQLCNASRRCQWPTQFLHSREDGIQLKWLIPPEND